MLKRIYTILFLALSLSAMAETRIVVTPERPVNCKDLDHAHINWNYKLEKMAESSQDVVYEFVTQHGSCVSGKMRPNLVEEKNAMVSVIRDGFVLPWQKEGVETEIFQESETEIRVRMTFDKRVLFKKKVERDLFMTYYPGENYGAPYWTRGPSGAPMMIIPKLYFPWKINLSVDETSHVKMTIN